MSASHRWVVSSGFNVQRLDSALCIPDINNQVVDHSCPDIPSASTIYSPCPENHSFITLKHTNEGQWAPCQVGGREIRAGGEQQNWSYLQWYRFICRVIFLVQDTDPENEATLLKAVSFYENTSRFVIRAIEEFEVDGHGEPDTCFHCEFFPTPGAEITCEDPKALFFSLRILTIYTAAFAFTIHTYSESGTFGIEHRLKYTPDPNHILQGKLGKFQDESDFLAHTAPLFFADLAQQIDLALGRSWAKTPVVVTCRM